MNSFFYRMLVAVTGLVGGWFFSAVSRSIAVGYFLFSGNVRESVRFYSFLYPGKSFWQLRLAAFRQYQNFTTIHYDRFLSGHGQKTLFHSEGLEKLQTAVQEKGAVLLMSHLGNWEIAAHLLKQQEEQLRLLLYMGVREKEGVERLQKEELGASGVKIIGVKRDGGSPFDALEGIRFLQERGVVSMAGDIVWRDDQRKIAVNFLGGKAYVPEAPYVFSLVSSAPILCFFSFRTGKNSYAFSFADPIVLQCKRREERREIIENAAQQYANLLEQQLRAHPFEWYHFARFIE